MVEKENQDLAAVRDRPPKGGTLPCGTQVCLSCHRQCGVVMAHYLSGLDECTESSEEES